MAGDLNEIRLLIMARNPKPVAGDARSAFRASRMWRLPFLTLETLLNEQLSPRPASFLNSSPTARCSGDSATRLQETLR